MECGGCVYIMANKTRTTLYTGVTSDLVARVQEHREHTYPTSFTSRYKCYYLVYYECFHSIDDAIAREKQIKGGSRADKIALIEGVNPSWEDLYEKEISRW
ncbi:MAG: GIY-YIG nuclease family protein [Bacteroidota bacterium]